MPFNYVTHEGTGLSFANYNAHELLDRLYASLAIYRNKEEYKSLIKNIAKVNHSWDASAQKYLEIY